MTTVLALGGSYACSNESSPPSGSSGAAVAAAAGAAASGSPLDIEFAATMRRVEAALHGAPRQIRIRGEQWATRLGLLSCVRQTLFRKDRNLHSELLLKCIEEGSWTEPMDKHPPEGPLPCLPRHVSCALRRQKIERRERAIGRVSSADRGWEASSKADLRAPARRNTSASRSASLADAAAAAVGVRADVEAKTDPEDLSGCDRPKPQVTVAVPSSAYSALAARVAHLEEQNRQLRRQLGQAQRRSFSPGGPRGSGGGGGIGGYGAMRGAPSPARWSSTSAGDAVRVKVEDTQNEEGNGQDAFSSKAQDSLAAGRRPSFEVTSVSRRGRSTSPLPQETLHPSQLPAQSPRRLECPLPQSPRHLQQPASERYAYVKPEPPQPPPEGDTEGFLRYLDEFQGYAGSLFTTVPLPARTD
eukprot:TRINITY_DN20527_c0_g1_i1.p1 TRINITY_DN20527_c0_g1~~TRINITY_DN20527_c0_g1_i1.p1  ORF type:complete len:415 (+),score=71.64 TRINITY_DN20527_c0_g1_i1:15-1259(+)